MNNRVLTVIMLVLMIALLCFEVGYLSVAHYKQSCEVIGNSQGQKWRECAL